MASEVFSHSVFNFLLCLCHCWHPNIWVIINSQFVRFLYLWSISVLEENSSNFSAVWTVPTFLEIIFLYNFSFYSWYMKTRDRFCLNDIISSTKIMKYLLLGTFKGILIMFNTVIFIILFKRLAAVFKMFKRQKLIQKLWNKFDSFKHLRQNFLWVLGRNQ